MSPRLILNLVSIIALSSGLAWGATPEESIEPLEKQSESEKADREEVFYGHIQQRNWSLGGSLAITKWAGTRDDRLSYSIAPSFQYFVADHISVGLDLTLWNNSDDSVVSSLGPSAYWYFWRSDRLASVLGAGARFGLTDVTVKRHYFGSIGLNYFIVPAVAVGPVMSGTYFIGQNNSNFSRFQFLFGIWVYL